MLKLIQYWHHICFRKKIDTDFVQYYANIRSLIMRFTDYTEIKILKYVFYRFREKRHMSRKNRLLQSLLKAFIAKSI